MKQQKGHAALLFILFFPLFFGFIALATDGVRAMQLKVRMHEATESGILAVIASNRFDTAADDANNREIMRNYLDFYFPDNIGIENVNITRKPCDQIAECIEGVNLRGELRYFEYDVRAQVKIASWFPGGNGFVGMGPELKASDGARAKKKQSETIDVILVADYSGSMEDTWSGRDRKYQAVHRIMGMIADELDKFNQIIANVGGTNRNTIGLSPFNFYSRNMMGCSYSDYYTNVQLTINDMFDEKGMDRCIPQTMLGGGERSANYFTIPLMTQPRNFVTSLSQFRPSGGTNFLQGFIRGVRLARQGTNTRRLVVILSDGEDNPNHRMRIYNAAQRQYQMSSKYSNEMSAEAVNAGICRAAKRGIEGDLTPDGKAVKARFAAIGFGEAGSNGYDPYTNEPLMDCVGEENVFKAENEQEILNKILELITEEIGTLTH